MCTLSSHLLQPVVHGAQAAGGEVPRYQASHDPLRLWTEKPVLSTVQMYC